MQILADNNAKRSFSSMGFWGMGCHRRFSFKSRTQRIFRKVELRAMTFDTLGNPREAQN